MAKRDPVKTARNKQIRKLTEELKALLPEVLNVTGYDNVHSLHAKIGCRHESLLNVKVRCIRSSDEFISLYLDAILKEIKRLLPWDRQDNTLYIIGSHYQTNINFRSYLEKFLERTFLNHYEEYARVKPDDQGARKWIGANNADYGILVTPRFNENTGEWENDKSEIRRFKHDYFTIGHILTAGLVIPDIDNRMCFSDLDQLLTFFRYTLVRNTGSKHQDEIAKRYISFVKDSTEPNKIPFLIPELRYDGKIKKHRYRLDFCVIDPYSLKKTGFELSPWSTHGYLRGTKKKSVKQVNEEAKENFEREIKKLNAYFLEHDISILIFTDSDLLDYDKIFEVIKRYLTSEKRTEQFLLHSRLQILEADLDAEYEEDDE